ncbi:hypothetical protein NL676_020706 [Syzygium grande]|nr:hypothetical protein NL676_020706 [Syzygium grande]
MRRVTVANSRLDRGCWWPWPSSTVKSHEFSCTQPLQARGQPIMAALMTVSSREGLPQRRKRQEEGRWEGQGHRQLNCEVVRGSVLGNDALLWVGLG